MAKNIFSFFSKNENTPEDLKQFLSFLQMLPAAACVIDDKGTVLFANDRITAVSGFKPSALQGTNISKYGLTLADIQTLLRTEGCSTALKEMVTKDLDVVYMHVGASRIQGVPYVLLTFDLAPQYREVLKEKQFFKSIVQSYPVAVTVQDRRGLCQVWNAKAEALFAKTAEQTLGKKMTDILPAELLGALNVLDKKLQDNKQSHFDQPMNFKNAQGKEVVLSVSKIPSVTSSGEIISVLTIYEDISARSSQTAALQQHCNLLQAVVDNLPLGIYTRKADGELNFYNKQSKKVFAEKDASGANRPNPQQPADIIQQYNEREQQVLNAGKAQDFPDEIYIDKDGNQKTIHVQKVPLKNVGPEPMVLSIVEDVTQKREQEREMITANNFLSAIVENAPIGLYARTKTGKILLRNKRCEEIFGTEGSEIDEHGALPHESQEQVRGYLDREAKLLESGQPLSVPCEEYRTAKGELRLVQMVKVPVRDGYGDSGFVITMVEDITDKKEKEQKLMEINQFQQAILDNAPVGIYARGVKGTMSFANKKSQEMFPGEDVAELTQENYNKREEALFTSKTILDIPEEEFTPCGGEPILLHMIKVPVFDKAGKPLMVLTLAEDITEKKRQEKAIRDSQLFLQNVVDNLPIALSVKRADGQYIVWNKKSEEVFGVLAKDVIGKDNYRSDITKEQAEFLRDSDNRVFASGREHNIPQELISTPTEGVKIMHTVKTPLFTADGKPDYLLNVSEDITAKTKMEKQIRETGEKNSLLVENAREGILILEDYKVIFANTAACKTLGYEAQEELVRKPLEEFVWSEHRPFAKEKYDAVLSGLEGANEPAQWHFVKKSGAQLEVETVAMVSKYLGRRIVIMFLRDVTSVNKNLREMRGEKETFKNVFERGLLPAFILNHKGYINIMNKAARDLFQLTENDRNFYRNVYIRPALTLAVRRRLKRGESAQMDYVFDFDAAAKKFPGRVRGEGKLLLHVSLEPFNRRDSKDGTVEADYLVTLDRRRSYGVPPPSTPLPSMALPAAEQKSAAPAPLPPASVMLPNTEPYALCSDQFKIKSCNDLFCHLCQLDREELKGQEILKLFSQDDIPLLVEDLKRLRSKGSIENRDYRIHLASGLETTPVRISAQSANGNYVFIVRNMAFQKQLMQVLQERSAQLNALMGATDGSVFTVHFEHGQFGRIEQANKFLSRLIGYSHDELTAMPFERLFTEPNESNAAEIKTIFAQAAKNLVADSRASFSVPLFTKEGQRVESMVTLTPLDMPGQNVALALVTDLSEIISRISRDSKEALELRSMRQSLPGLYLKTDAEGRVLEVSSNLAYLSQDKAQEIFLDKLPAQYWPEEVAAKELFALKEASSVNINTTFEFEWEVEEGQTHFFEVLCTPIHGQKEIILWAKDVTQRRIHEKQIRELYAISNENKGSITDQVDRILAFGNKVFKTQSGIVMRFNETNAEEMTVVYSTPGPFQIERYMVFPVEECLFDVKDDNVVVFPDLGNADCKRCIHKEKKFGSLIAAPLYVGGKVAGALCFASDKPRGRFEEGAEELIGIMSRILSLRIELREASKTLGETSQSFIRTLEYVDLPAVVMDLKFRVKYANEMFLNATGRRRPSVDNREFFHEFIRAEEDSRRMFMAAEKQALGKAFQINLGLADENGKYLSMGWDVFLMKDIKGEVEGYGLIGVRQK